MPVTDVLNFIDDFLLKNPDRFEFLYWQSLLYFYKV